MTYLRMNHFLKLRTPSPTVTPADATPAPPTPLAKVPKPVVVSRVRRRHVAMAACAILVTGCGRDEAVAHSGQPSQVPISMAAIPQAFARDPSVPDASEVFAAQEAADKARAAVAAAALPAAATPAKAAGK